MANWWDVVTDKYVRGVANRYVLDNGMEAFNIFPAIPTNEKSGLIAKYTKDAWFRIGDVNKYKRIGATESYGDDYDVSSQSYYVEDYSFHKDISKDDRNEYDDPYQPVADAVTFVMNRIKRVILSEFVSTYMAKSVWSGKTDQNLSSAKWNAKSSGTSDADPIDVVAGWKDDIAKSTGFWPNKMIVSPDVHTALRNNTKVRDVMKNTSDKIVTDALIAKVFELDSYHVLRTINSQADNFMKSGALILVYTPSNPTKMEPSAGYHVVYRGAGPGNVFTKRIPMPALNDALRIEATMKIDPLVIASDLGMYAYNVV